VVVLNDHTFSALGDSPRDALAKAKAHLAYPLLMAMPGLRNEDLRGLVPEVEHA
jgi:hypothetical protein